MKRGEFLRRSLLATVGLAILPIPEIFPQRPKLKQPAAYCFKVNKEMLSNKKHFNAILNDIIKTLETEGRIISYEIGFIDDDFARNLYTVRIELT